MRLQIPNNYFGTDNTESYHRYSKIQLMRAASRHTVLTGFDLQRAELSIHGEILQTHRAGGRDG